MARQVRSLNFDEVVRVLARVNDIAGSKIETFKGRVKNFQRLGYPSGINTGRGKPALYLAQHILLLGLAVELTQLGLPPERAVRVLTDDEDLVRRAIRETCYYSIVKDTGVIVRDYDVALQFDPCSLGDLSAASLVRRDPVSASLKFGRITELANTVGAPPMVRRTAFVNVSALIRDLAREGLGPAASGQFREELTSWVQGELVEERRAEDDIPRLPGRPNRGDIDLQLLSAFHTAQVDPNDKMAVVAAISMADSALVQAICASDGIPEGFRNDLVRMAGAGDGAADARLVFAEIVYGIVQLEIELEHLKADQVRKTRRGDDQKA